MSNRDVLIELNAVVVAVSNREPQVLLDADKALPSGPFATEHRTLEQGLRAWALAKAGLPLGYVEQLYTFADKDRAETNARHDHRMVSIGYLALARSMVAGRDASWSPWYRHFPWEDHRAGVPEVITKYINPALKKWAGQASTSTQKRQRLDRVAVDFPAEARQWNEELVLQRYELLWEAGLVAESQNTDDRKAGVALAFDHRRILATAMARLRAKIKYRPVVFELMPESFTLLHLQETVEALAGLKLHKQNFRRLIESQGLVEETGAITHGTAGRPAKLFAFRREVLRDRAVGGTKLPRTS